MTSLEANALRALGGRWIMGERWSVPERRPDGLIVGWVEWSANDELRPEHGSPRGLIFDPAAIAIAGVCPESPVVLAVTLDDLLGVHAAGFHGVARPHVAQGHEAMLPLVEGRHAAVVVSAATMAVLAGSALCAVLETAAASVAFLRAPTEHRTVAAWLAASPDPRATLATALADAVGAPRRRGGAA